MINCIASDQKFTKSKYSNLEMLKSYIMC